jgi:hypothetical protein
MTVSIGEDECTGLAVVLPVDAVDDAIVFVDDVADIFREARV